jgi:hypothetical protein
MLRIAEYMRIMRMHVCDVLLDYAYALIIDYAYARLRLCSLYAYARFTLMLALRLCSLTLTIPGTIIQFELIKYN